MRVMVMIMANPESETGKPPSDRVIQEMGAFNQELVKNGIMLSGEGLKASSKGKRVQFRGKQRNVIDGPFTETKELVAGFWIWKVASMAEALEWVKRIPNPDEQDAEIEIRPLVDIEDCGPEMKEQDEKLRAQIAKQS